MEIRKLEYFLMVAREKTILGAAEVLHITQPTLTRQLKELEDELGRELFIRSKKGITLTQDGVLFRKRAEEIIDLVRKTEEEFKENEDIQGSINIASGETSSISYLFGFIKELQKEYSKISLNIISCDGEDVIYKLEKGLVDFGLIVGNYDIKSYNYIELPDNNYWGIVVRRDEKIAKKNFVTIDDLIDKNIIMSRQVYENNDVKKILGSNKNLNIVDTYNLIYNANIMVKMNMGYAFTLNNLISENDHDLVFIPYKPKSIVKSYLIWKKYGVFSEASRKLLELIIKKV